MRGAYFHKTHFDVASGFKQRYRANDETLPQPALRRSPMRRPSSRGLHKVIHHGRAVFKRARGSWRLKGKVLNEVCMIADEIAVQYHP